MNKSTVTPPNFEERLRESDRVLLWVNSKLDGMKIPQLADDNRQVPDEEDDRRKQRKRSRLACACWHVAVEHSMAIVVLVHEKLHGSALALIRPLFEAYARGMWLMHAATDDEVDRAGHIVGGALVGLKKDSWSRLCSFTHTGYQQIGARLTPEGLGYDYQDGEILQALEWADGITLMSLMAFAGLTANETLANEALEYLVPVVQLAGEVESEVAT